MLYKHKYTYAHALTYIHTHTHKHTRAHTLTHNVPTQTHKRTYVHTLTHTHAYIRTHAHTYICAHARARTHTHTTPSHPHPTTATTTNSHSVRWQPHFQLSRLTCLPRGLVAHIKGKRCATGTKWESSPIAISTCQEQAGEAKDVLTRESRASAPLQRAAGRVNECMAGFFCREVR